ncbi:MAG TPA: DUF2382 domain-containing protein [Bacteroidales bacterium]|jgi:stress response protein YsnF|nr:DUF2382 domain-containing protein [Bacteroidales bacterium]
MGLVVLKRLPPMHENSSRRRNAGKDPHRDHHQIIPVISEEVVTGRRLVRKASILIGKSISTAEVEIDVPLTEDQFDIERVPVNQYLDSQPEIRYEGNTTVIPVMKEVMVKRLLLTEEIRITRKVKLTKKTEKVKLKKQEVKITRKENDQRI